MRMLRCRHWSPFASHAMRVTRMPVPAESNQSRQKLRLMRRACVDSPTMACQRVDARRHTRPRERVSCDSLGDFSGGFRHGVYSEHRVLVRYSTVVWRSVQSRTFRTVEYSIELYQVALVRHDHMGTTHTLSHLLDRWYSGGLDAARTASHVIHMLSLCAHGSLVATAGPHTASYIRCFGLHVTPYREFSSSPVHSLTDCACPFTSASRRQPSPS